MNTAVRENVMDDVLLSCFHFMMTPRVNRRPNDNDDSFPTHTFKREQNKTRTVTTDTAAALFVLYKLTRSKRCSRSQHAIYVTALAFRTEIWFVAWGKAEVSGKTTKGGGGGVVNGVVAWGEPRLLRRVLPGAEGALRSLAAAGRWLFVASDQKVVLPTLSGSVNAAFAAASLFAPRPSVS